MVLTIFYIIRICVLILSNRVPSLFFGLHEFNYVLMVQFDNDKLLTSSTIYHQNIHLTVVFELPAYFKYLLHKTRPL